MTTAVIISVGLANELIQECWHLPPSSLASFLPFPPSPFSPFSLLDHKWRLTSPTVTATNSVSFPGATNLFQAAWGLGTILLAYRIAFGVNYNGSNRGGPTAYQRDQWHRWLKKNDRDRVTLNTVHSVRVHRPFPAKTWTVGSQPIRS